eukprot:8981130-Pyramimonas_sp.AAC.1
MCIRDRDGPRSGPPGLAGRLARPGETPERPRRRQHKSAPRVTDVASTRGRPPRSHHIPKD